MNRLLAIDPGNLESAWVLLDVDTCRPIEFAKEPNAEVRWRLRGSIAAGHTAIEMIASYGMTVGREVFETCVWIGRFSEALAGVHLAEPTLVYRRDVKLHHCHSAKAKDSNIRQALCDRFAPGVGNYGKGTKDAPGWFYGFSADVWAAYAVGVYRADLLTGYQP